MTLPFKDQQKRQFIAQKTYSYNNFFFSEIFTIL
jgi:hypothetical protein